MSNLKDIAAATAIIRYEDMPSNMRERLHAESPRHGKYLLINSPSQLGLTLYMFPIRDDTEDLVKYVQYLHEVVVKLFDSIEDLTDICDRYNIEMMHDDFLIGKDEFEEVANAVEELSSLYFDTFDEVTEDKVGMIQ